MTDLVDWLRRQLDEDERVAREAARHSAKWQYADSGTGPTVKTGTDADDVWARKGSSSVWSCDDVEDGCPELAGAWEAEGEHIARWDPARVLAEVEAKRAVLDQYEDYANDDDDDHDHAQFAADASLALEGVVKAIAQPYAGRPGWREEWSA